MKVLKLIDLLEEEMETAQGMPFTSKHMIDRERCLEVIAKIRLSLPEELQQAEWVKKERQKILEDAHKEAAMIKQDALEEKETLLDQSQMVLEAREIGQQIAKKAHNAKIAMMQSANEYVYDIMEEAEKALLVNVDRLRTDKQQLSINRSAEENDMDDEEVEEL